MLKSLQDRETPLHIAVRTKNVEMVNLLLDHGASTDAIDKVCPQLISVMSLKAYIFYCESFKAWVEPDNKSQQDQGC